MPTRFPLGAKCFSLLSRGGDKWPALADQDKTGLVLEFVVLFCCVSCVCGEGGAGVCFVSVNIDFSFSMTAKYIRTGLMHISSAMLVVVACVLRQ